MGDAFSTCGVDKLSNQEQKNLWEWYWNTHLLLNRLSESKVSSIEKIKYDGKLIVCEDGTKYESSDDYISDTWFEGDKIAIVNDSEMFNLDQLEKINITRDDD